LKEGWPLHNVRKVLQSQVAAGVVDFDISHNAGSAEEDLFLRDDLKDLRLFC